MNIRKENLGPLDPIFPLDKTTKKGYNGLKQEPISALAPDTNSLYVRR